MGEEWSGLEPWWLGQVGTDPIFQSDVAPLLRDMMPIRNGRWLDLGCGEGRMLRELGGDLVGCDLSHALLTRCSGTAPVVACRLPDLGWLRSESLEGAYAVLVLEHLPDVTKMFEAVHRVVKPGGSLVVVANHPAFTAAGAGPIVDLTDGEVLWRWGPYLDEAPTLTDVGGATVTFHHRPIGAWLRTAATARWVLEDMQERGLSDAAIAAEAGYADQAGLPRLVGWRWRR
jgi:SAM-dependent methyltransferase